MSALGLINQFNSIRDHETTNPFNHPPSCFIVDPVQRYLVQPTNHQRQSQRSNDTDDDGDDFCDDWDEEEDSGGGGGWVVLVVVIFSETLL